MTIPTASSPTTAVAQAQGLALNVKTAANNYIGVLQAGNIDTNWVFNFLDQCRNANVAFNNYASLPGISAAATSLLPNYTGTFANDITSVINAINGCISWVTTNFPADTGGFLQGFTLNADGTRTARQFTPTQTAGLVTALQSVVAQIS